MLDQNLLRNHMYNTSVLLLMIEQNDMIHDIEVEVHHDITIITKTTIHKTHAVLHLKVDSGMTKVLLLRNTLDHDMTTIKETRDLIALLIDPHPNDFLDVTLVTDIDHAHIQDITIILQDIHLPLDNLQYQ